MYEAQWKWRKADGTWTRLAQREHVGREEVHGWQIQEADSASLPMLVNVLVFEGSSYRPIGDSAHLQVSTYASHSDSFNHYESVPLRRYVAKIWPKAGILTCSCAPIGRYSMLSHPPNGITCQSGYTVLQVLGTIPNGAGTMV